MVKGRLYPIQSEYNIHDDVFNGMLKQPGNSIENDVVYQALQISACYPQSVNNPTAINEHAVFYRIGLDETGIPIVVTRIGEEGPNKKKLVIAGPHGDERNAQRLIMAAQKHFIDNDPPSADTVLYFIPCLSPTMCFADARGIPNKLWEHTEQNIPSKYTHTDAKVKVLTLFNGQARLKPGLTISVLHATLLDKVRDDIKIWKEGNEFEYKNREIIMRTAIQDCNGEAFKNMTDYSNNNVDPYYPRYGIDANRDIRKSLQSTRLFEGFIRSLLTGTRPEDIKIIMMHGYDNGGGTVYGTYRVESKDNNPRAVMIDEGRDFARAFWSYLYVTEDRISNFYYPTETEPLKFAGEWNQLLYKDNRGILSVDIELPSSFDEGRRGDIGNPYNSNNVRKEFDGILASGKGNYYELLGNCDGEIDRYKNNQRRER
jgi:hypothetical protein